MFDKFKQTRQLSQDNIQTQQEQENIEPQQRRKKPRKDLPPNGYSKRESRRVSKASEQFATTM
jgi:hypothetical protein